MPASRPRVLGRAQCSLCGAVGPILATCATMIAHAPRVYFCSYGDLPPRMAGRASSGAAGHNSCSATSSTCVVKPRYSSSPSSGPSRLPTSEAHNPILGLGLSSTRGRSEPAKIDFDFFLLRSHVVGSPIGLSVVLVPRLRERWPKSARVVARPGVLLPQPPLESLVLRARKR